MSVEENKALFRRWIESWHDGTEQTLLDQGFDPDCIWHLPGRDFDGLEAMKRGFAGTRGGFPVISISIEDLVAEGDRVMFYITVRGTHRGRFMDIAPTGKTVKWWEIGVARFANGKIAEVWDSWSELHVRRQLGFTIVPPEGESEK